jgi:hypothetical protein
VAALAETERKEVDDAGRIRSGQNPNPTPKDERFDTMTIVTPEQPRRSNEEIAKELRTLRSLISRVPSETIFGDDNQEAIEAQIKVIKENMDFEEAVDMFEGQGTHTLSNAVDAVRWLWDDDEPVSQSWSDLAEAVAEDDQEQSRELSLV